MTTTKTVNEFYNWIEVEGTASEIKAVYKALLRNENNNLYPAFCDFPMFNENRSYRIIIDLDTRNFCIARNCECGYLAC